VRWSGGLAADVDLPPDDVKRGAAVLALPSEQVRRLGSKGYVRIGQVR